MNQIELDLLDEWYEEAEEGCCHIVPGTCDFCPDESELDRIEHYAVLAQYQDEHRERG